MQDILISPLGFYISLVVGLAIFGAFAWYIKTELDFIKYALRHMHEFQLAKHDPSYDKDKE